jgi:hypothetical protein
MELPGSQVFGYNNLVVKDNYVYVGTSTTGASKSRIYVFDVSDPQDPDLVETSKSIGGFGLDLYLAEGNLCLHTSQITTTETLTFFDISDPEDLSVVETADLEGILDDELGGWGSSGSSSTLIYDFLGYGRSGYGYQPVSTPPFYPVSPYGYELSGRSLPGSAPSGLYSPYSAPTYPGVYGGVYGLGYPGGGGGVYGGYNTGGYPYWASY